ncbi:bifunctional metallophosphatase/5'-nucleotidase [Adhaeribacter aquaticus]|uniref:bifunctional metallophosphatase/5'-nucleotidase n=1 Tax=Adhaeribacter aquaticus TaxID=299567 RepID=UPI00042369F6|nr:metallophosphatase [Adhaeribacter aquaticus]
MNRRNFIRTSVAGAAGLSLVGLPTELWAANELKLTILHTNDMHSRIDPFPAETKNFGGKGGMARLATLVNQIRSQEPNVLLLDCGDIWQGTPYFNFFGGELEYKLMTQMQYDAATLGNHDFDNGLVGLQRQLPHAGFSFLNANYDFSKTILKDQFKPYKLFNKGGVRVGVFGLGIELAGLVDTRNYGNTVYLDPLQRAADMVKQLREVEQCHLVVCLSHLGYDFPDNSKKINDRKLATQVSGIDLILGGHTHTFLEAPEKITHATGPETLINQVGWSGVNLGRIDYIFNNRSKEKKRVASAVLPIDSSIKTS